MDNLKETIATLSPEDVREFRLFINRQKKKKGRKDLELFHLLLEKRAMKPREIIREFYREENRNAYHSIRKRLFRHLTEFILLKQKNKDTSASSSVMGMISLSRYLFDKKLYRPAWIYLEKAEEIAIANEQFDLLNSIYNLQIERYSPEFGGNLKNLIRKRNENKKSLDEDERAIIAKSIIQNELNPVILEGKELNFDRIISRVLKECELTEVVAKRPKLLFNIITIVRSAILANKDYFSFEPYIIGLVREAEKNFGFTKSSHYYKLKLLYMIAHVLYRNRKFDESEKYLEKLYHEMEQFNRSHFDIFFPKYLLLLAVIKSYQGKNKEAISIQEKAIKSDMKFSFRDELNIFLNQSVYHFNSAEYKKANEIFLKFDHSDHWYGKKLGKEWVLRKNLMEVFLQYEMGNDDIAMNRIRSMERFFESFFENPAYKRVKIFLGLVKDFLGNPASVSSPEFEKKIMDSKIFLPDEHEDIRAIAFFCWLKSKMVKQPYYKVLVERVNMRLYIAI